MEYIVLWIAKLPIFFQVSFLITVLTAIIYCLVVIIDKGFKISKEGFELPWKKPTPAGKGSSPHKACIHSKDVLNVLFELPQLTVERMLLENFKGLRQVMNHAEQQADLALALLLRSYISLLDDKCTGHPVGSMSYMIYRLLLRDMRRCLLDHVKTIVQENSYTGLTDSEFDIYATARTKQLIEHATDFLNEEYFYNEDATRDEVYNTNRKAVNDIEKIFRTFFDRMRIIGESHKKEIKKIDDRIQLLKSYF